MAKSTKGKFFKGVIVPHFHDHQLASCAIFMYDKTQTL